MEKIKIMALKQIEIYFLMKPYPKGFLYPLVVVKHTNGVHFYYQLTNIPLYIHPTLHSVPSPSPNGFIPIISGEGAGGEVLK